MSKKDRGFSKLKDVKITRVVADAVNQVTLFDDEGNFYVIEADVVVGVPFITCTKYKEQTYELPTTKLKLKKD